MTPLPQLRVAYPQPSRAARRIAAAARVLEPARIRYAAASPRERVLPMPAPSPSVAAAATDRLAQTVEQISGELEFEPLRRRICDAARRLAGARSCALSLFEDAAAGGVMLRDEDDRSDVADPVSLRVMLEYKEAPVGQLDLDGVPGAAAETARATLDGFARHAAIAIENARRYARERRRTARFELISRVARIINAGLELDPLLQQTADAIHDMLEFPNVDIPLLDPDDPDTLVVAVRGGSYKRLIQGVDRIPVARGIMGAAVRERRSQRVDDVYADPRYVQPPVPTRMRAELAVPILVGDEVLGVVNVEGEHAYDELDQRTIEIIADHLGIAIQNARLFERNRAAAVWQERQRLRRELHDSVTQILSSISLLAQALPSAWRASAAEGERRAQRLAELAQSAFAEMRALLRELQPPEEAAPMISRRGRSFLGLERLRDGGLSAAVTRLLDVMIPDTLARRYQFERYSPQHLPHEEALYRVCQEAVSNVIRHSGAHQVVIEAFVDKRAATLVVRDDGGGLPDAINAGIGLKSMQQRVASLGGQLTLRRGDPRGLVVTATLPRRDRTLGDA